MTAARPADGAKRVLVLFDIDGTLVRPNGAGSRALFAAGSALFGDAFRVEGVDHSGKLDLEILREIAEQNGHLDLLGRAGELMELYLAALAREAHRMQALPGAATTLARLAAEPNVALGIVTGNHARAAALKLEVTGLVPPTGPDPFAVRACGDDAATRPDLVALARSRYLDGLGGAQGGAGAGHLALVMVGDSPRDVEAGHAHGVPVLAVATGRWDAGALAGAGADRVVTDLRDPEPLLELIREARTPG